MFLNLKEYKKDREVTVNTDNISNFYEHEDVDGKSYVCIVYIKGTSINIDVSYKELKMVLSEVEDLYSYRLEYIKSRQAEAGLIDKRKR